MLDNLNVEKANFVPIVNVTKKKKSISLEFPLQTAALHLLYPKIAFVWHLRNATTLLNEQTVKTNGQTHGMYHFNKL